MGSFCKTVVYNLLRCLCVYVCGGEGAFFPDNMVLSIACIGPVYKLGKVHFYNDQKQQIKQGGNVALVCALDYCNAL